MSAKISSSLPGTAGLDAALEDFVVVDFLDFESSVMPEKRSSRLSSAGAGLEVFFEAMMALKSGRTLGVTAKDVVEKQELEYGGSCNKMMIK